MSRSVETAMRPGDLVEFHNGLLASLGDQRFRSAVPLQRRIPTHHVADGPSMSYVSDSAGKRVGVLFVSSAVNPHSIARSVANALEAKKSLGRALGPVVSEPLLDGVHDGLSYALWPLHRELSSSRVVRYFQKKRIRRSAVRWLAAATRRTLRSNLTPQEVENLYKLPLTRMREDTRLSQEVRKAASQALQDLSSGCLRPVTVWQHSDLWLGNFLVPFNRDFSRNNAHGFIIIDWGASTLSGHPFIDLLRFSMSSGVSPTSLQSEIDAHCQILGCRRVDAISYPLAAQGVIGMNLEHMPESIYLDMCQQVFETASQGAAI